MLAFRRVAAFSAVFIGGIAIATSLDMTVASYVRHDRCLLRPSHRPDGVGVDSYCLCRRC
jgi:hypothetical protein